jgi:hypothetical protein
VFQRSANIRFATLSSVPEGLARSDPEFFDREVGDLTDYVGYFYARRLDIIAPFEIVEFDDSYMFTENTDPFVVEIVRDLVKTNKLFVITQAFDNELLCQ